MWRVGQITERSKGAVGHDVGADAAAAEYGGNCEPVAERFRDER
jgi:hypothetical protein